MDYYKALKALEFIKPGCIGIHEFPRMQRVVCVCLCMCVYAHTSVQQPSEFCVLIREVG